MVVGEKSGSKRYFKPNDSITRAELSVIVWQVMAFDDYIHFSSHVLEKLDGVPVNDYDNAAFVSSDGMMTYTKENGSLRASTCPPTRGPSTGPRWPEDGIDFAIIRCGGRYYQSGTVFEDQAVPGQHPGGPGRWHPGGHLFLLSGHQRPGGPGGGPVRPGHHPGL